MSKLEDKIWYGFLTLAILLIIFFIWLGYAQAQG